MLTEDFHKGIWERWSESIFWEVIQTENFAETNDMNKGEMHSKHSRVVWGSDYY